MKARSTLSSSQKRDESLDGRLGKLAKAFEAQYTLLTVAIMSKVLTTSHVDF